MAATRAEDPGQLVPVEVPPAIGIEPSEGGNERCQRETAVTERERERERAKSRKTERLKVRCVRFFEHFGNPGPPGPLENFPHPGRPGPRSREFKVARLGKRWA